jgi:Ca2+-binding EF-hand superfamily protein
MKPSAHWILVASTLLGAGLAAAQDTANPAQSEHPKRQIPKEVLAKYDTNGDGKLDATELAKLRLDRANEFIAKHDKDGDGKLSAAELAAAFEKMGPRPGGPEGKPGREGGLKPEVLEKIKEHRAEMLKKYDTNGDGKLDDGERAKMRADRAAKLVAKFDKDGDGKLNAEELVAARIGMRLHARFGHGPEKTGEKPTEPAAK